VTRLDPFHLAIPVDDLAAAERFYGGFLGCPKGRSSERWIDFNFFGHQLVAHLSPEECAAARCNEVDGEQVPVRHFGIVLEPNAWRGLADRLKAAGVTFLIEPEIRFAGQPGEQGTFFLKDPAGNALEFKCFDDPSRLFAT
jgi:extradiol dioxygenase family protein